MDAATKRVFTCCDAPAAHILCNRLIDNGVRARVVGDLLASGQFGAASPIEVWAHADDAEQAKRLLIQWNVLIPDAGANVNHRQFGMLALLAFVTFAAMLMGVVVASPYYFTIVWTIAFFLFTLIIAGPRILRPFR